MLRNCGTRHLASYMVTFFFFLNKAWLREWHLSEILMMKGCRHLLIQPFDVAAWHCNLQSLLGNHTIETFLNCEKWGLVVKSTCSSIRKDPASKLGSLQPLAADTFLAPMGNLSALGTHSYVLHPHEFPDKTISVNDVYHFVLSYIHSWLGICGP